MTTEASIERACVHKAKEAGCLLLKQTGQKGMPDRLLLVPGGQSMFIEFKRPGGQLSPIQRHMAASLRTLGFQVEEVDSVMLFCQLLGSLTGTKSEASSGSQQDLRLRSSSHQDSERPRLHLRQQFSLGNFSNEEQER